MATVPQLLKQLVAVVDSRTTFVCLDVAGDIIPVNDVFETLTGDYLTPPFHIYCRSVIAPWVTGMVNTIRDDANAEIKRRPAKQKRRGPAGYEGRLPPPPTGPGRQRPLVFSPLLDRDEDGIADTIVPDETVARRVEVGEGAELIEFTDGTTAVLRTGEPEDIDREELAAEVATIVGAPVPDVERLSRTELLIHVESPVTLWEAALVDGTTAELAREVDEDQAVLLGVLDLLIGHDLRHGGTVSVVDEDRLVSVWHGATFGDEDAADVTSPLARWVWRDAAALLRALPLLAWQVLLVAIRPAFQALGRDDWWQDMTKRLTQLRGRVDDRDTDA